MADRDYQHSRPLDVHRWSEHIVNYMVLGHSNLPPVIATKENIRTISEVAMEFLNSKTAMSTKAIF